MALPSLGTTFHPRIGIPEHSLQSLPIGLARTRSLFGLRQAVFIKQGIPMLGEPFEQGQKILGHLPVRFPLDPVCTQVVAVEPQTKLTPGCRQGRP